MSSEVPIMQIMMYFLNCPDLRCMGPSMIMPIMPEMMGLPPTQPTATARFSSNQGLSRQDKMIESPLKMPKQQPKARSSRIQLVFFINDLMDYLKGSRLATAEQEGGVGGLLCCRKMFGRKHTSAMMNSTNMRLKVRSLPSWMFSGVSTSMSYWLNTTPGMSRPMISETLRMSVSSWVTPPLFYAVNQFAEILAWQFKMKGRPIPAITCPTITQLNESFTSILSPVPIKHRALPIAMPTRVPQVSIAKEAGKVKRGCMSAKSRAPEFTTRGSCSQISSRQRATGVRVLTRHDVISWAREKRKTIKKRLGQTVNWSVSELVSIVDYK